MKLTDEQQKWAERHHELIALLVSGKWRAVPIQPTFEMLSAMADQSPESAEDDDDAGEFEDGGEPASADLMRWYAALAMVRQPEPFPEIERVVLSVIPQD